MSGGRRNEPRALDLEGLERASRERLDDELLRECRALLLSDEPADEWPRQHRADRARSHGTARQHLLVARLAFETELFERALSRTAMALAAMPGDPTALWLLGAIQHRRGRLSDAIAAWERLLSRKAEEPSGLRDLGLVYELAAHAGDSRARPVPPGLEAALGESLADLTQSCRSALVDDLQVALRAADRALSRARGKVPHVAKVAAIQRAWVLERAHDVQAAIATLERLADEPGLANDVERLLCLSVLYEREGTPERVRRAVRAVRYAYLVTREPMLLRRLARLLAALGHAAFAEHFEARYLDLFLRRHGVLSPRELARAATAAYVPHERLSSVPLDRQAAREQMSAHAGRARPEHRRRAAVLALCLGEVDSARRLLRDLSDAGSATAIDALYLADAEERCGQEQVARELRLASVRDAEIEPLVLLALARAPGPPRDDTLGALGPAPRLLGWLAALRRFVDVHPASAPGWRALSMVTRRLGRGEAAAEHGEHARALEAASARPPVPVTLAAAALRRGGEVHGLIHELWVEREASAGGGGLAHADVLGSVSTELRAKAVNVFYSVRAFAEARFPHRIRSIERSRFLLKVTKDDELSSGDSAGLPMAIAFLAAFLELEVPAGVASSGAVVCDARGVVILRRVGDIEAKIVGAYERRLRRLLLPVENREDVERAERVPLAIATELVHYVRTLEDVIVELFPQLG